jgi:hypothetical protein
MAALEYQYIIILKKAPVERFVALRSPQVFSSKSLGSPRTQVRHLG